MELTNDYQKMHDMVRGLGQQALLLNELPRINISDKNPWKQCKKKVMIVFQSRTGTTWLCDLLNKTGVLGKPRESLHASHLISEFKEKNYDNLNELMTHNVAAQMTENGVYSAKSGFPSLAPMFLLDEFPTNIRTWKFIFMKRIDELGQAISVYKLIMNRQSASWTESKMEISNEDYSFKKISNELRNVKKANYAISVMLKSYDCDFLEVYYENLNEDPEATLKLIANFIGVELEDEINLDTKFEIQRNELSKIWKKRWLSESIEYNPLNQRIHFFE
jgi:LPS sulfotransferase NodH